MVRIGLIALVLMTGLGSIAAAAAERRPNVLFVMVDEMRWNAMGCAGNPIVRTPNLDKLAAEGTRFATAYTVAPICTPSRYSFFTGRYAHVHGATDNQTAPTEPLLLLPSILKHSGYQTAISGKLHFIPANRDYDFESFWSFASEGPGTLQRWPEFLESKTGRASRKLFEKQPFPDDALGRDLGKLSYPKEYHQTAWITDRAIDFLKGRDGNRPFFLFVSYLDPHSPSHLTEPYWSMYDAEKMPLPATFRQEPGKASATATNRHEVNDPAIVKALTAAYYAKMTRVDDNVGRLMGQLKAAGLDKDTLVVFTADHGNMLGDLNRWFKGAMYEGSTRIPLIIKAPTASAMAERFNRGRVVEPIVENIDVMPTLCEMIGVPLPPQGIQGRSFTGLVADKPVEGWKNRAFAQRTDCMIRTEQYKLIRHGRTRDSGYELYDLKTDPMETKNLASDPACAEVMKKLASELDAWAKDRPAIPVIEGLAPLPPEKAGEGKPAKERRKKRTKQE